MTDRWATFDCYGTLIDWFDGVRSQLVRLWPDADTEALLTSYLRAEARLQEGRGTPYREVMAEALEAVGQEQDATVPQNERYALAASLPSWGVFPEVPDALRELRARGWKLAILSNTDPDLLDASIRAIDVPIDERIVASDIGSYKPAFGHWETFFRRTGADRTRHVHVAASLFHDIEPCAKLGLPAVWINRRGETSMVPRSAGLPDLTDLPDTLERLSPA
ncbi:MAG TPA: HAD family hydrolase [Actinomycetota bacterium]|nr:HAD family hydrolase [Actinomycetota bacterium]